MKVVYIESCYECPFCVYNSRMGLYYCIELWNTNDGADISDCIIDDDMMTSIKAPDMCPLMDVQHDNSS